MYGFDSSDGTPVFKRAFDSQAERYLAPTVDNGVVFEDGGYFGGMYAFDANVGTQSFYTMLQQYDEWTPAVDANYAYAYVGGPGSSPGQLSMVDRNTGTLVASIMDPSFHWHGYSMFSAPVLGQPGTVFAVNVGNPTANSLLDFDTNAQTIRWQVAGGYTGNPAYGASVLYAVNSSPYRLEARSESDGTLLWSWAPQPLRSETGFVGDVLATNNLVFVSTNTTTYAISQSTHEPVWSIPIPGRLALSANGVLYVVAVDAAGATNGTVLAVNVKD
jgi:outer membrane protein assembly factor BamB